RPARAPAPRPAPARRPGLPRARRPLGAQLLLRDRRAVPGGACAARRSRTCAAPMTGRMRPVTRRHMCRRAPRVCARGTAESSDGEPLRDLAPVDRVPPSVDVVRALVLVLQVVGV